MSAWVVSKGHIDVLTNGLVQYGITDAEWGQIQQEGSLLWHENHRSVNYRYEEDTPTPPYTPTLAEADLDPRAIIAAISCYEYQSCEHPQWDASTAHRLTDQLARSVEAAHPGTLAAFAAGTGREAWFRWGYEWLDEAMPPGDPLWGDAARAAVVTDLVTRPGQGGPGPQRPVEGRPPVQGHPPLGGPPHSPPSMSI